MNTELKTKAIVEGQETRFYKDVKVPIKAGLKFGPIKTVGYEVFRQYFDTNEMDFQVGSQRIKRIIH